MYFDMLEKIFDNDEMKMLMNVFYSPSIFSISI